VPADARVYVIGDIHGRFDLLRRLRAQIIEDAAGAGVSRKVLVHLGDYVDRGDSSRQVIDLLIDEPLEGFETVFLSGNHEAMMLDSIAGGDLDFWLTCGGFDTVGSYDGDIEKIPLEHIDFLKGCRKHWQCDSHFFVHANYRSELSLASQSDPETWNHQSSGSQPVLRSSPGSNTTSGNASAPA